MPAEPVRNAWEEQWQTPTFEQLMALQKEQHVALLSTLLERLEAYDGIERSLIWHGQSWKWTIQYTYAGPDANEATDPPPMPVAYFVPNPESPVFCMPLRQEHLDQLPMKRLNRFIRDGIRSAKCAVEVHWAKWSPTAMTEVEHLTDLIKRRHKMLVGAAKAKSGAA
ncbi:MAG: hypothetical protein AAF710_11630 [Planctomycetota bacterium]